MGQVRWIAWDNSRLKAGNRGERMLASAFGETGMGERGFWIRFAADVSAGARESDGAKLGAGALINFSRARGLAPAAKRESNSDVFKTSGSLQVIHDRRVDGILRLF